MGEGKSVQQPPSFPEGSRLAHTCPGAWVMLRGPEGSSRRGALTLEREGGKRRSRERRGTRMDAGDARLRGSCATLGRAAGTLGSRNSPAVGHHPVAVRGLPGASSLISVPGLPVPLPAPSFTFHFGEGEDGAVASAEGGHPGRVLLHGEPVTGGSSPPPRAYILAPPEPSSEELPRYSSRLPRPLPLGAAANPTSPAQPPHDRPQCSRGRPPHSLGSRRRWRPDAAVRVALRSSLPPLRSAPAPRSGLGATVPGVPGSGAALPGHRRSGRAGSEPGP